MSAFEWLAAALALLMAFNAHLVERALARQRLQIARLTRRVWTLEGCPRGDA